MSAFILMLIGILELIFYILCFKQKIRLLTIGPIIWTFIPVVGFTTNTVFLIIGLILAHNGTNSYDPIMFEVRDTKFNRWLFNHLNWK